MKSIQNFPAAVVVLVGLGGMCISAERDSATSGRSANPRILGEARFLNYGRVFSLAFSPDGRGLAAGAWDGSTRVWEVATGKQLHLFQEQSSPTRAVAFSPSGKLFAAGGRGGSIVLRDSASGKELGILSGHKKPVTNLAFTPDGKSLASSAADGTLRLWSLADKREIRQFAARDSEERIDPDCPVAVGRDGRTIVGATTSTKMVPGAYARTFRIWNIETGAELRSITDQSAWHGAAAISPDGRLLANWVWTGYGRNLPPRIDLCELDSGRALPPVELGRGARGMNVGSLTFARDGKLLALSDGGSIQLWEIASRSLADQIPTPESSSLAIAFSPSGGLLASGGTDTTTLLWDLSSAMSAGKPGPARAAGQDLHEDWKELGDPGASRGRIALSRLVSAGSAAVEWIRQHLPPVQGTTSPEEIERGIAALGSPQYPERSRASAVLIRLGEQAEPALQAAQQRKPPLEMRKRIDDLLRSIAEQRARPTPDRLRALRAVEALEKIGSDQAVMTLEKLAAGTPGAALTREARASLERLGRNTATESPRK
jgi:hypothetical protein